MKFINLVISSFFLLFFLFNSCEVSENAGNDQILNFFTFFINNCSISQVLYFSCKAEPFENIWRFSENFWTLTCWILTLRNVVFCWIVENEAKRQVYYRVLAIDEKFNGKVLMEKDWILTFWIGIVLIAKVSPVQEPYKERGVRYTYFSK